MGHGRSADAEGAPAAEQSAPPAGLLAARDHPARASRSVDRAALDRNRQLAADAARRIAFAKRRAAAAAQARRLAEARRKAADARAAREAAQPDYVLPLIGYRLTAGFGDSGSRWSSSHTGQDFAAPTGTPVRAISDGVITSAEWAGAYGWRIELRHPDGTVTWYCHLSGFAVRSGNVSAGQTIGRVGSSGNTSGPHLHLEVRVDDQPISPLDWLRKHGLDP